MSGDFDSGFYVKTTPSTALPRDVAFSSTPSKDLWHPMVETQAPIDESAIIPPSPSI